MRDRKAILPLDAAQCSVVRRDLRIGDILAAEGKLDRTGIEQVLKLQESRGLRFGEAALRLRLITPEDLRSALARQYDFPYVPLDGDAFGADLAASRDARHPNAEQLRALRTQLLIQWSKLEREPRALAIASPGSSARTTRVPTMPPGWCGTSVTPAPSSSAPRSTDSDADLRGSVADPESHSRHPGRAPGTARDRATQSAVGYRRCGRWTDFVLS